MKGSEDVPVPVKVVVDFRFITGLTPTPVPSTLAACRLPLLCTEYMVALMALLGDIVQ